MLGRCAFNIVTPSNTVCTCSRHRTGLHLRSAGTLQRRCGRSRVESYDGILPDLFAEGEGVVATGFLGRDGTVTATEVLAKHDENYMPPEVAEALENARATAVQP